MPMPKPRPILPSPPALEAGGDYQGDTQRITEIKTTLGGERRSFDCELLHLGEAEAVVVYRMPRDVLLEDVLLPKATLSLGYFWQGRPYNAYHWVDARRDTLALYFNIADRTRISPQAIEWRDLTLDVLITPDRRCRVLDEDELPAALDPALAAYIAAARSELCRDPLSLLSEYDKLSRSLLTAGMP